MGRGEGWGGGAEWTGRGGKGGVGGGDGWVGGGGWQGGRVGGGDPSSVFLDASRPLSCHKYADCSAGERSVKAVKPLPTVNITSLLTSV